MIYPLSQNSLTAMVVGALISLASTVVVTRLSRDDVDRREVMKRRRELLERIADELALYMVAPTAVAHVVTLCQHGKANGERAATALEMLVTGYEHLNSAIYVASLIGDPSLSCALDAY